MIAPSLETIEQFLESLFSYTEGWIALRSFPEAGKQGKPALRWIANDDQAASQVYQFACEAHQANRACYLIPGTVAAEGKAGSADVMQTGVLLVDIDTGDSEAKLAHLSAHLGKPSLIICSGGITETGARKLHVYWRLSEAAEGDDVVTACRLREQIALKVGGDTSFKSAHQPIRIAGSIYHKTAEARLVTIEERNGYEYHLGDLAEAITHMPPMEGTDYKQPKLNWSDFNDVKPATEELMTMKVHEGGKDGITRFEAISTVMGYVIRRYHEGLIDQQEAWDEVWGYNLTCLRPAWPEERVRGEMKRLWEKHCRKYGVPTAYVPPEERQAAAPDIISYRLAELLDNPPAVPSDIIAPRILTPNSVMLFAGAPKVGKSDFLLSMFLHMAAGEQFLHMQPREPLRIFYLQMEIHGYYVSERIQSLAIGNDIKQRAAENMFITPRLRMLLDKDGVVRCAEHIRTRFGKRLPDVICIDPIRNVFDGGKPEASENDNSAMMFFLHERVERLRDLVNPEAGIIIVHHTRKQGKKQFEEDPLQAISGASALRGFYDSGLILFRPDEVSPERQLFTELRNGPEIPPCIIEKVDGRWVAKNLISERLVAKEHGRKMDAERRRKYNVILQLLYSEAREGRLYTMNQFAEAFENQHHLGSKDSLYERLGVLATQGYIRFTQNYKALGLKKTRSKLGLLCIEDMEFKTEDGEIIPVLPTHYKFPGTGACLEVQDPNHWTYPEEDNHENQA